MNSTFSNIKASIVERFNRTLRREMHMKFSLRGTYKWTDILQELLTQCNSRKHRTIGIKPRDVKPENANQLRMLVYKPLQTLSPGRAKFRQGAYVSVSKNKHVFEKGYTPNWTTEIFQIRKKQSTNPVTYLLKDYLGNPILGEFYMEELNAVKYPDLYLIEKVLKKKQKRKFVK